MSHHPLQEELSPSTSLTSHYRHHSDASLAAHLESAASDKSEVEEEEEKQKKEDEDDDIDDIDQSPVIQRTDPPPSLLLASTSSRTPNSGRPLPHPPPSHRSLTPLPPPHPTTSPSPPPPPLPSSVPVPFTLRLMSSPPRAALPISLKNQPTRERQRTIHHLLSQSSGVTSISSPEYEFSEESSTRSQPNTPSQSQRRGDRERPSELLFVKESVDGAHPVTATSSLTTQIQRAQAPTPPVYRRQQSPRQLSATAGPKLKLTVFLPVNDLLIQLEVRSTLTSETLIKVVLDIYRRENATNLHPAMLDSVRHYQLFIAEETGRVDEDFPGLDPRAVLATTAATHFALKHLDGTGPRRSPTPSYPRRSVSQSSASEVSREVREEEDGGKRVDAGGRDGRMSLPSFGVESPNQSSDTLVRVTPWYASLLCCARVTEEEASEATERRRSAGESVGGMAVAKQRSSE